MILLVISISLADKLKINEISRKLPTDVSHQKVKQTRLWRKSEIFNLQWSDIDFDRGIIAVQAKKDWHTKKIPLKNAANNPCII